MNKRTIITLAVIAILATVTFTPASRYAVAEPAQNIFYPPPAPPDQGYWVVAIGSLDIFIRSEVINQALQGSTNPFAYWAAFGAGRREAEDRFTQAVQELCSHDQQFCQDTFQAKGVRWHPEEKK